MPIARCLEHSVEDFLKFGPCYAWQKIFQSLVTEKKAHEGLPGTAAIRTVIYKGIRRFCLAFSFDSKEIPRYPFSGGSTGVLPHQVPNEPGQVSVGKRQRLFCVLQRIPERVPVSDDWRSYHKGRDLGDRNL